MLSKKLKSYELIIKKICETFRDKFFGYEIGHINFIRKFILGIENLMGGHRSYSGFVNRILHWSTGNTIYYLDYENGDDVNDGSDWANAWKTITAGPTAARIVPGDVIRIAKSPDPTSLGCNGTWTDAPDTLPTSQDIESSTNATPIVVTLTGHGYVNGDIVYIQNHTTNLTANGTWTVANKADDTFELEGSIGVGVGGATGDVTKIDWHAVKLATAQTKTITRCEELWTLANTSTVTLDTSYYKEGDASVKIVKNSPANDTLYAYFEISDTDFSSYQKISFWMKSYTTTLVSEVKICLCSDIAGATPVDTFLIPAGIKGFGPQCIIKEGGGNLGASIKSIAFYTDSAAPANISYMLFDNILACTTSGLNLQSLISKSSAAQCDSEGWYGIQSISEDGTIIKLDNAPDTKPNEGITTRGCGYSGTTETVTTYKRETIKLTAQQIIQDAGISGNNIEFQAGYNISTTIQDGTTFFDGRDGSFQGLIFSQSYITINYINIIRCSWGVLDNGSTHITYTNISGSNCIYNVLYLFSSSAIITNVWFSNNCGSSGIKFSGTSYSIENIYKANNNQSAGIEMSGYNVKITKIHETCNNSNSNIYSTNGRNAIINEIAKCKHSNYGIKLNNVNNWKINSATISSMDIAGVWNDTLISYLNNCSIAGTEFSSAKDYANSKLYSTNHDGTPDNHYIYTDNGVITSDITNRHTASGICWKLSPTNVLRDSNYPLDLSIAKVACAADSLVTINAWVKKSHATTIVAKLVCKGGQIAGVATDVTDTKADDTDYEELEITFTPTEAGVVEIEAWAYGGTTESVYVDDMTITQA